MRFMLLIILLFSGCTDTNKSAIIDLLQARNASISQKDIEQYSSLLSVAYRNNEGAFKLKDMQDVFLRFDEVRMTSRDHEIRLLESNKAICEQTYILQVFADGKWRKIVQREQLMFERINNHWKIVGGL